MFAAAWALALPAAVPTVPVTIDFESLPVGTAITSQYANAGGAGQGLVFGPLPGGGGATFAPVIRQPGGGQPSSGAQVAEISTCPGCEIFTPRATATFAQPQSQVSVAVGYLGSHLFCTGVVNPNGNGCANVTLRAFDASGTIVATSQTVELERGSGVRARIGVTTPGATIVGIEITARKDIDANKVIGIDDLTFGTPAAPAPADFALSSATQLATIEQGGSATIPVAIARLGGSTGGITLAVATPPGIHATLSPNPADGAATSLTITADATAAPTDATPITVIVTGTPLAPTAGASPRTLQVQLAVKAACKRVATVAELVAALAVPYPCIAVADDARLDIAQAPGDARVLDAMLHVPDGVTLRSGRSATVDGGLLYMSHAVAGRTAMLDLGSKTHISGLRLRGYVPSDTTNAHDATDGIRVRKVEGVTIDGNEISAWPNAAVEVFDVPTRPTTAAAVHVTGNFIHHNVQCGSGYGVVISELGYALIDRNVFAFNRHDVADDGKPGTGYAATLNFLLAAGPTCGGFFNQHFDMHGTPKDTSGGAYDGGAAGEYVAITRNAIHGAQSYGFLGHLTRPAFELRGTPAERAVFVDNAVAHDDEFEALRIKGVTVPGPVFSSPDLVHGYLKKAKKLVVHGNRYGVDTSGELAVGDFDGDGHTDVFQATGALWAYAPSGSREWRFLNASNLPLGRLGFGDFNGDGKTDVFAQSRARWLVSLGGSAEWRPLPVGSSIPSSSYRFGDFDGDRKTDVFRANGTRFWLSSGGASPWKPLAASRLAIGKLRFGDFNGDGMNDVFSLANGNWSVSLGGTTGWRRLNGQLSANLSELRFADFNGDRRTDVARSRNGRWQVSWSGATVWRPLQTRSVPALEGALLGSFSGNARADVLMIAERRPSPLPPKLFPRWRISSGGTGPLVGWARNDMR